MQVKRRLSRDDSDWDGQADVRPSSHPPSKRVRLGASISSRPPSHDVISSLPAELLVRIFSYMSETTLLELSTVSRLFYRVAADRQLWRAHYYRRFILPRAHLIPGFRRGTSTRDGKVSSPTNMAGLKGGRIGRNEKPKDTPGDSVDWKKSYKLLHNWARGRCDVEELHFHPQKRFAPGKTVVKVVEGYTITADAACGLLVWDLRTRAPIAQAKLESYRDRQIRPLSLAVYDEHLARGHLGIAAGFEDGTFGVWAMDLGAGELVEICRHDANFFGGIEAVAYCHPYVLAASKGGFITLWTFEHPNVVQSRHCGSPSVNRDQDHNVPDGEHPPPAKLQNSHKTKKDNTFAGSPRKPELLRSLKSHSTKQPLTLSMRTVSLSSTQASFTIASIVYTLDTINGWCIGIQELDIHPNRFEPVPDVTDSRLAYTIPARTRGSSSSPSGTSTPTWKSRLLSEEEDEDGPIGLCYSHPYLLATLPDNTLILHMCRTMGSSLLISPGTRLWGHTSGISDAEITTRGKAVSVSARGDEIRVWELEGRVCGSVEVRPRQQDVEDGSAFVKSPVAEFKKNKVGFDDEMVIVLQEGQDGQESLMVYDFT